MSYKAGIISAITELKERTGSSSIDIKHVMQAKIPEGKKWMNTTYLVTLKKMVAAGELVQTKGSYKVSADFKTASKNKVAAGPNICRYPFVGPCRYFSVGTYFCRYWI